jgi:hypothetical protein
LSNWLLFLWVTFPLSTLPFIEGTTEFLISQFKIWRRATTSKSPKNTKNIRQIGHPSQENSYRKISSYERPVLLELQDNTAFKVTFEIEWISSICLIRVFFFRSFHETVNIVAQYRITFLKGIRQVLLMLTERRYASAFSPMITFF